MGGLDTSQSCQSFFTTLKTFLKSPVLASTTTTESVKRFSPSRAPEAKSGAGLPPGTYSEPFLRSRVYEVQVPPPLMGMPGALFQVLPSSGDLPTGPRTMSPSALGTRKNCQTILPVFPSSAYTLPLPPLKSPPALPTYTRPSDAIGAEGTDSPRFGSQIEVSHTCLPVLKSKASTRQSCVPRNSMPSRYAAPRLAGRRAPG